MPSQQGKTPRPCAETDPQRSPSDSLSSMSRRAAEYGTAGRIHEPTTYFHLCSDAMYETTRAAMGGFCHGLYWSFEVPLESIAALSIPILEFLGVVLNIIVFGPMLKRLIAGNPRITVVLRTDALTAALTLPAESQRSALLVAAYQWLRERVEFVDIASSCFITHLFGDANPYSDCISRGKWEEFMARCKQIGVKPVDVRLPFTAYELFDQIVALAKAQPRASAIDPETVASMQPFRAGGFQRRRFGTAPTVPELRLSSVTPATATTEPQGRPTPDFLTRRFGSAKRQKRDSAALRAYREPIDRHAPPRTTLGLRLPAC